MLVPSDQGFRVPSIAQDLKGIYNYLKWLATDPPFDKTEQQLRDHLLTMIHDDVLTLEDGKYWLKRKR